MLTHPTIDKIKALKLYGMAKAFEEQQQMANSEELDFEERLGLLIDREQTERDSRRLQTRLRRAKLSQAACLEDIDFQAKRGLDKSLFLKLASCDWIASHLNLILTGPTDLST